MIYRQQGTLLRKVSEEKWRGQDGMEERERERR